MHAHRGIIATFGASSGFSAAAFWEWITSPSTASGLAFLGSAASTGFAWWLSRRADAARNQIEIDRLKREAEIEARRDAREAEREQDRLDREQERMQKFLDMIVAARLAKPFDPHAGQLEIKSLADLDGSPEPLWTAKPTAAPAPPSG